jgi:hypothetical protein
MGVISPLAEFEFVRLAGHKYLASPGALQRLFANLSRLI